MGHAVLSPSSASRWMACTPSARLEENFENKTSEFAEEGTLAHAIGEAMIRRYHEMITAKEFEDLMEEHRGSKYYSEEMMGHCEAYMDYVNAHVKEGSHLLVEQKLDMTSYVPEGFGTGDILIMQDRLMDFIDLKYGKGVPVNAFENKQLMLYALGAYNDYGYIYEVETIRVHIFQPRLDSISSWEISVEELIKWADEELKDKAKLAFDGKGEYKAGKHCHFCRAKVHCKALHDHNIELAAMEFKDPDLLTEEQLIEVYEKKALFENWINAVSAHLLQHALAGNKLPGYKVVLGRGTRVFADPADAEVKLKEAGYENIYTEPKLVGITEMTKRLGKPTFIKVVEPLLMMKPGNPALVVESDKRPEYLSVEEAFDAFAEDDMSDLV